MFSKSKCLKCKRYYTLCKVMNTKERPFKIEWRCFSCGRRFQNKNGLYSHLHTCYWFNHEFKTHIEDAPFYKEIPTKQLRYYWRNKKRILAGQKAKRERDKKKNRVLPKSMR